MNAKELKKLADLSNTENKEFWERALGKGYSEGQMKEWLKNSTEQVGIHVSAYVEAAIQHRAQNGHYRAQVEPFTFLPGILHKEDIEDKVMISVCEGLEEEGFSTEWDRREKRVVLVVTWES